VIQEWHIRGCYYNSTALFSNSDDGPRGTVLPRRGCTTVAFGDVAATPGVGQIGEVDRIFHRIHPEHPPPFAKKLSRELLLAS
jgi:hypothetical protein